MGALQSCLCDRSPRCWAVPGSPATGDGCVRKVGVLSAWAQAHFAPPAPPVMLAEIVKHFYPRLVDLHNYVPTCNTDRKLSNWSTLNRKVFHKLRLWVSETDIRKVVANTPGAIEPILCALREKVTDGAAHQHPPGTAGPGPSGGIADGPWAELCAPRHAGGIRVPGFGELRPRQREEFALREGRGVLASDTTQAAASQVGALGLSTPHAGLPGPTAASSVKTPQTPEKTGCCVCTGGGPAGGPWGHLDSGLQQLLEEKEQALAVLQEMVKILQMKVVRLEHLVKLKDQRIGELTRLGDKAND
uniref:CH-like domain-containing protein n=1 Tax=Suricata suricatta TaxID=37032 RepID=A0A673SPT8_SURSU